MSQGENKDYVRIGVWIAGISAIIVVLALLFGEGIFNKEKTQVVVVNAENTNPPYTLIDESILSQFTQEELDQRFPWTFVGMVVTTGWPTDTLSKKYEFVGFNWDDGGLTPKKIWNLYVRQPQTE